MHLSKKNTIPDRIKDVHRDKGVCDPEWASRREALGLRGLGSGGQVRLDVRPCLRLICGTSCILRGDYCHHIFVGFFISWIVAVRRDLPRHKTVPFM